MIMQEHIDLIFNFTSVNGNAEVHSFLYPSKVQADTASYKSGYAEDKK